MARKFKKRLSRRQTRSKTESVLSISLIRKGYFLKLMKFWKYISSKIKSLKLAN